MNLESLLACPVCHTSSFSDELQCSVCLRTYKREQGRPSFLTERESQVATAEATNNLENRMKNFFKRWPWLYDRIAYIISPVLFIGLTAEQFIRLFVFDQLLVNVGSGPTRLSPRSINIDMYPFLNVDVLAQAGRLPFMDASFDAAVCDQVLEHVIDPWSVVRELERVTKPGGLIYIGVPFLFPLHPSPKDYARWSTEGVQNLFSSCDIVESGMAIGPTSSLLTVLADWLALVCSLGIRPLQKLLRYFWMLSLFPCKYLDLLFARIPGAETIAAGVYVVARKR